MIKKLNSRRIELSVRYAIGEHLPILDRIDLTILNIIFRNKGIMS